MVEREKAVGPRACERVQNWMAADTLGNLTEVAAFRHAAKAPVRSAPPLIFTSNKALWKAILDGVEATENRQVELQRFVLTEWAPLRPGRFHTRDAYYARMEAMASSLLDEHDERPPQGLRGLVTGLRARPNTRVFNPDGKMRMVDGGIGCVRLKPLPNRATHRWPFGASSSMVVHEGALVALSDHEHDRLIEDVRRLGGLRGTIFGTLRFVPRDDFTEPMFGRGIPQIYIEVDHFEPEEPDGRRSKAIDVTAAVTFTSKDGNYPSLNVSYVTFNAARRGDLDRAVDWLDLVYVRNAYHGRVVTDFDEQTAHFDAARFSLHKLLHGLVSRADVFELETELGVRGAIEAALLRRGIVVLGDVHGDIYAAEQAVAIGPNASVSDAEITINRRSDR